MLFTGKYDLTLDEKKRLSIPAAIRSSMDPETDGTGFYITVGHPPGTLALFGNRYFRRYAERLASEMVPGEERLTFEQVFYSQCAELDIDKQGRVILPEHLVDAVNLGRSVCLTGSRDRLVLWNKEQYEAFVAQHRNRMMELQTKAWQGLSRIRDGERTG